MVVVLEYILFDFVPTTKKSLRLTRFRRSYVNCIAVVLTNHCQSYTTLLLVVRCSKRPRSFFLQLFVLNDLRNLFLLSTRAA